MAIVRDYVRSLPISAPPAQPAADSLDSVPRLSLMPQIELVERAEGLDGADTVSVRGVSVILQALSEFEGQTWQQRWQNAGCQDPGHDWKDRLGSPWQGIYLNRAAFESANGIADLIALDVIRPSYTWLRKARPRFHRIRLNRHPEFFARMTEHGVSLKVRPSNFDNGLNVVTKVLVHTGVPVHELRPEHLLGYRDYQIGRGQKPDGLTYVWSMLKDLGIFDASTPGLLQTVAVKRPSVTEMVDSYGVRSQPVRDMLVRYLKIRETSVDYSTIRWMVYELVKNFWLDIEVHNPEADSLHISFDEGRAWLNRFTQGSISTKHRTLFMVRGLYLDIASWATDDAYWAQWAAPSFLTREDTSGANKHKRRTQARIHQRIRELSPLLPKLLTSTAHELKDAQALLAAGTAADQGQEFEHQGVTYRRQEMSRRTMNAPPGSGRIWVVGGRFERRVDLTQLEDNCFWSWALINTLNETGVRIEELVEITTHAFSIYRLPETGEALPLLQIVPSKTDRERILLISPELAHVFALVKRRISNADGRVPLAVRYDGAERVYSPPLPHLFQLRTGSERRTMSPGWVRGPYATRSTEPALKTKTVTNTDSLRTISEDCLPHRPCPQGCPYTFLPSSWAIKTSPQPRGTQPFTTRIPSGISEASSTGAGHCGHRTTTLNPVTLRSRTSMNTSKRERSNWAPADELTEHPASTNTLASDAQCSVPIQHNAPAWKNLLTPSKTGRSKPNNADGWASWKA